MSHRFKLTLLVTMTTALACGFLHHLIAPEILNFERLHIFLFNLCSGGSLLLYFTEDQRQISRQTRLFFILSLTFALCAFCHWYLPTLILPLILGGIVERIRITHFGSFSPRTLWSKHESVSRKFHQAALLCLSIGLFLASPVILNSVYGHWLTIDKLKLDTFFLGFSFPLSLISMSVIFSLMESRSSKITIIYKELAFWVINLGVIIFFLFILAQWFIPQVVIASTLFLAVVLVLYLYAKEGMRLQQKAFLTSGILFLLVTSLTGILYILLAFSPYYTPQFSLPLLRLHAFTALYGWNLSGLAVISRHGDFPIQLHSRRVVYLHWFTVLFLCPLGYFFPFVALLAIAFYAWLLFTLLFNYGPVDSLIRTAEDQVLSRNTTPPEAN